MARLLNDCRYRGNRNDSDTMPYRFKRKEDLPASVVRIVTEQTGRAAEELGDAGGGDIHEAVHDARKRFKKTRSLLRLIRSELGDAVYRRENDWFRSAAHRLAGARDAEAMIETYDQLAERYPELGDCGPLTRLRDALIRRRERIVAGQQDLSGTARELAAQLQAVPERLEHWRLDRNGFGAIAPGLERSYRRGRKALHKAYRKRTDEAFHEWRKRVKDYWYHSRLLRRTWPALLETRVDELKRLSDLLGDDHDLAVLRATLHQERDELGGGAPLLACLAAQRQQELRAEARDLGSRLYAAQPECEVSDLKGLWRAWKRS